MSRYEWSREQLDTVDPELREDVLSLIRVWEQMVFTADDPRRERVLSIFNDLARGIAIEKVDPESAAYEWVDATRAKPRQKDPVRIKRDAFTGEQGRALNGKEGIVARIARGTLVVAIDGGSLHVQPDKLEARIPKNT